MNDAPFREIVSAWMSSEAYRRLRSTPVATASRSLPPGLRLVEGRADQRYVSCVPLLTLAASAGAFGESQTVEFDDWVEPAGSRTLAPGMFVAQIVGRSMEPKIPDGSYGLFRARPEGSRNGRIVLAQHRAINDPEHGGRYTVKQYRSEKIASEDGSWRHVRVILEPFNRDYEPIVLDVDDEHEVAIVAELVEVLEGGGQTQHRPAVAGR